MRIMAYNNINPMGYFTQCQVILLNLLMEASLGNWRCLFSFYKSEAPNIVSLNTVNISGCSEPQCH